MLEEIQGLINARPFVPFRIVLASGDRFDVRTPNQLTPGNGVSYYTFLGEEGLIVIRNNQLSHIEINRL